MGNRHPTPEEKQVLLDEFDLPDMSDQAYKNAVQTLLSPLCERLRNAREELNILVVGREGHGKSSYVNTLFKTMDNKVSAAVCTVQDYTEGGGLHTGTVSFHCYSSHEWATKEKVAKFSWIKVHDTRGWKFSDVPSTLKESYVLNASVEGWLRQDADMDESKNVKDAPRVFEKKAAVIGANRLVQSSRDRFKVDLIVWVFDATAFAALSEESNGAHYKIMADVITKSGCPWIVAFTKMDEKKANIDKCHENFRKLLGFELERHMRVLLHNVQAGRMAEPVEEGVYASHLKALFHCLVQAGKIRPQKKR